MTFSDQTRPSETEKWLLPFSVPLPNPSRKWKSTQKRSKASTRFVKMERQIRTDWSDRSKWPFFKGGPFFSGNFPVKPNRSIWFPTEISGMFGIMKSTHRFQFQVEAWIFFRWLSYKITSSSVIAMRPIRPNWTPVKAHCDWYTIHKLLTTARSLHFTILH